MIQLKMVQTSNVDSPAVFDENTLTYTESLEKPNKVKHSPALLCHQMVQTLTMIQMTNEIAQNTSGMNIYYWEHNGNDD